MPSSRRPKGRRPTGRLLEKPARRAPIPFEEKTSSKPPRLAGRPLAAVYGTTRARSRVQVIIILLMGQQYNLDFLLKMSNIRLKKIFVHRISSL
jgi:hypothetical protein